MEKKRKEELNLEKVLQAQRNLSVGSSNFEQTQQQVEAQNTDGYYKEQSNGNYVWDRQKVTLKEDKPINCNNYRSVIISKSDNKKKRKT